MNNQYSLKAVTLDELQAVAATMKEPSFSSVDLHKQYSAFFAAAVAAAESKSNDADRYLEFVNTLDNLLSVSGAGWGGTWYCFIPTSEFYQVYRGDLASLYTGVAVVSGRVYLSTTAAPSR
ncbi:MAG TPA: hypothetical protein VLQ93_12420 [Myxococcaceae bacterium]|nr:hypothetical protein [Myxococcaceae bacterium]